MNNFRMIIIFGVCMIVFPNVGCSIFSSLGDYPDFFNLDDYPKLIKDPSKNFTILNLADVQLGTLEETGPTFQQITALVKLHQPDLITMTGDQIGSQTPDLWISVAEALFPFMNSFGIPWAPILGNHDTEGIDMETLVDMYGKQSNCLFQRGPADVDGEGNYIINVFDNDVLLKTLIFLDSHGWDDYITFNQQKWYDWVVNGIKGVNPEVKSILFFHIPLFEFAEGYEDWKNGGFNSSGFGERNEKECTGQLNSGFFSLVLGDDNTKDIIIGHDHVNDYSVMYKGIRLTYGLKTGPAAYHSAHLQGGTIISLQSNGEVDIYHSNA